VRDGDHYIVNGHKTWTTLAQHADWIFLPGAHRPGGKGAGRHLVPADRHEIAGRDVRPIITIDGSHEVNDVFLEDVRVPIENLIGEENKGWTYAKFLLGNERTSMASIGRSTRYLNRLKQIVKTEIPRTIRASANSSRTSHASNSTCSRSRRRNFASSPRCRAASIRDRQPRCSRSGAPRYSSASPS